MTTIEQLQRMLERRGYTLYEDEDGFQVPHHTGWLIIPSLQVGLLTTEQWKQEIDVQLGQGQLHMQHSCGHVLLRGDEGETTRFHVYRDVQAGPQAKWVWECPNCHEELREDEVYSIDDD